MIEDVRYDRIGIGYDTTRRADPYIAGRLFELLKAPVGARVLDVACGSGNYTAALARRGLRMVGVDQSATMLDAARHKSTDVHWCRGEVGALPFADARFDGALCTLALHHFPDLRVAIGEMRRVMRGGRLVFFTATREQMRGYWLNAYFPIAMERSIEQMPDWCDVESALLAAGFSVIRAEPYDVQPDLQDFFLYSGKLRPEIYLDPNVRAGISTFSLLADADEVDSGCRKLAGDLAGEIITNVLDRYRHSRGDYLFVVAAAA